MARRKTRGARAGAAGIPEPPLLLAGVVACFVLSGFAALVYQTAWLRQFSLAFGTSELAVATVLAAYMAGLALGAGIASRFVARVRRPILVYGLLEAAIAVSALSVPWLLDLAASLYAVALGGQPAPPDAARIGQPVFYLAVAFVVLAVPTGCMGATLPLLIRHAVKTDRQLGPRVALLYATNTAGAVLGTLTAAFLLLPAFGLRRTVWFGVLVNAIVFTIAATLAKQAPLLPASDSGDVHGPLSRSVGAGRLPWILPLMLVSGANAFFYEVLWTRMLSHVMGGSIYAFATMLAAFLTGIALGGALAGRLASNRARAAVVFASTQIGVALLSMGVYAWMALRVPATRAAGELVLYASAVLLPATIFIGATFPLAVRILAISEHEAPAATARIYAWNTVGAIVGATLAGFFLIPSLGFEGSIKLAVATNLVLAAATLALVARAGLAPAAVVTLGLLALLAFYAPARPQALIASSGFASDRLTEPTELFYAVGRSSTVLLLEDGGSFHLRTNGLPEGLIRPRGSPPGLESAAWLTALPVVARPDTRTMLVIGLGGGVSLEGVPPSVTDVDVIELEPEVIRANRMLEDKRNKDPLTDPRIHVVVNDGRNALRLTSKTWDAIVSQPSHPWTAGASHLFTREFVRLAKEHLNEAGVFVQWMDSTLVNEALLRSLAATLRSEFRHVRLYRPTPVALIFLASDAPLDLELELARTGRPLDTEAEHFRRLGMGSLEDLVSALALDRAGTLALAADAPLSTDDTNRMATESRSRADGLQGADVAALFGPYDELTKPGGWIHAQLGDQLNYPYLAQRLFRLEQKSRAHALAEAVLDPSVRFTVQGLLHRREGDRERAAAAYRLAIAADPTNMQARYLLQADSPASLDGLTGLAEAIVRGRQAARDRNWGALARMDLELSKARVTDVWYPEAAGLRAQWRLEVDGDRARLAREALSFLDGALHLSSDLELRLLRFQCAVVLGDEQLLTESARAIVRRIEARLNRERDGQILLPDERERLRNQLTAINVQLESSFGARHEGAQQVLRRSRDLLGRPVRSN